MVPLAARPVQRLKVWGQILRSPGLGGRFKDQDLESGGVVDCFGSGIAGGAECVVFRD